MARLSIALLGPFQASLDGQPITTFRSDRVRALLAYLVVEADHPHARDTLAALLWPGWPEEYARHSLRSALANLRQAIGDADAIPGDTTSPHLLITRETIQFDRESDHSLDVAPLLERGAPPCLGPSDLERLRQGIAHYRGDFLEGFSIADSAAFEEWALQQREYFRQRALGILHRLAATDLEGADYARAESFARRSLQLEPWDEQAHRQVMQALALQGQRSAALAQYEACRRALAEGLGVEPEKETTRLCERIKAGEVRATAPRPAAPTGTPTTFLGGRYTVQRPLGEGARKAVYLARDTLLDREVALALLKIESLDEDARAHLRREAQAMGRLGLHPNIVAIYDTGEEAGQPFIVTEYMAGGDVEGLLAQAPQHRLPLERALEIMMQVCRGLHFAHGKGIVHRDLKPSSVWLTAEGTAKICDFGLAPILDAPRLTQEGTVSYVSPEQATGGEVTPRADLYALGCMLYEMVAGRPPFLGDDPVAIVTQHVHTSPVAPTWHNPHCPRDLEALILRLLAKDPAQRPMDAAEVLTALEGVDLGAADRPANPQSLDSLAGGTFVGRQREMGELKAALEQSLAGRGRLLMLVGEPGIGKTRTALELATYAGLRRAQVLWGRCYEGQGMPPFWPWVQAIRAYVRDHPAEQVRAEMGSGAAEIAQIVSDVRQRLPDVPTPPTGDDPESARFRFFDAVTTFLKTAVKAQPLVLILDDLHWADRPSLLLLQFLAGELAAARLLVLGCYRDVELSRKHPLAQALGELMREQGFQRVLLRGLTQEDVGRFVELTAGIAPPSALVHTVHTRTEGNPLFISEVVRLLVQEGQLAPERLAERASWAMRIPEGVREAIGRRLDRLSERCNQVLTLASVIGREFTLAQMRALVEDQSEERLLGVLEEGMAGRIIEELPGAMGRYQFTHGLIQETLAEELSATRRMRLHARIAQALEDLYGSDAEAHAAELAYHYGEAEAVLGTDKLAHYSLLAGERALTSYAWEEAVAHFQRGLATQEGQPADDEVAALLFGLGKAQFASGEMEDSWVALRRACDYYERTGNGASAAAAFVMLQPDSQAPDEIVDMAQRVLRLVPTDSIEAGIILCRRVLWEASGGGDYESAHEAIARALEIAQHKGAAFLRITALEHASWVALMHFHWQEARDLSFETIRLASSAGDMALGAIRLSGPASDLSLAIRPHSYAAIAMLALGDLEGARRYATEAVEAGERVHHRPRLSVALRVGSLASQAHGDLAAVRVLLERWLAIRPFHLEALAASALLEASASSYDDACPYLEAILKLLRQQQYTGEGLEALVSEVIAWLAHTTGVTQHLQFAADLAQKLLGMGAKPPLKLLPARMALALIAVQREDASDAGIQYQALQPHAGMASPLSGIVLDHLLGLLAGTMGDRDHAAKHFEAALAFERKGGYRPELAWTCCDYADLLRRRNAPGDSGRAADLLGESLALAQELGMRPLAERVQARHKA